MAVARQSARHHNPVCALLQGVQDHQRVQLAGAWQLDDLDRRWILHAQATCEVGRGIGAMLTAIGNNLKILHNLHRSIGHFNALQADEIGWLCFKERLNFGEHLVVGVVHQLDGTSRALGCAGAASLADTWLDER